MIVFWIILSILLLVGIFSVLFTRILSGLNILIIQGETIMGIVEDVTTLLNDSVLPTLQTVETSLEVIDQNVASIVLAIQALQANQTDPTALANLQSAASAISDETAKVSAASSKAQDDITAVLPVSPIP